MDFKLRVDTEARTSLPDSNLNNSCVRITGSHLYVHLGEKFEARVDLAHVGKAQPVPDPQPQVYLPFGVSAAVETLGSDTLCVIGSREGLVALDFDQPVDTRTRPLDHPAADQSNLEDQTVRVQHLILSLEDPEGFVRALNETVGSRREHGG